MSALLLGELAALAAAVCFSFGPTFFTLAGRQVGSLVVNRWRLLLAFLVLTVAHLLFYGEPYPLDVPQAWGWLFVSGALGLAISDAFLFEAFVRIGPRMALLVLNLVPVLAALAGVMFFAEHLSLAQWLAIGVTLIGVTWVVAARPVNADGTVGRHDPRGLLFAFVAVFLQTASTLLAKGGMQTGLPALSGNLIRMSGGVLTLWGWTLLRGQARTTLDTARRHPRALGWAAAGVLIGPVLGMSLSLFALKMAPVGIVSTLGSLTPVFLIPISRWAFGERIGWAAVWGTLVATAGVAWLLLLG